MGETLISVSHRNSGIACWLGATCLATSKVKSNRGEKGTRKTPLFSHRYYGVAHHRTASSSHRLQGVHPAQEVKPVQVHICDPIFDPFFPDRCPLRPGAEQQWTLAFLPKSTLFLSEELPVRHWGPSTRFKRSNGGYVGYHIRVGITFIFGSSLSSSFHPSYGG